jgi:hypothetical protein
MDALLQQLRSPINGYNWLKRKANGKQTEIKQNANRKQTGSKQEAIIGYN